MEKKKALVSFYFTPVSPHLCNSCRFKAQGSKQELSIFKIALEVLIWDVHGVRWTLCSVVGGENGGNGCSDWPAPKSLLWLPQHGSWGGVGGDGRRRRRRRRWRRSIEASASCESERGQIQLSAGQRLRHTPNSKPWKQSRNMAVAKREQWGERRSRLREVKGKEMCNMGYGLTVNMEKKYLDQRSVVRVIELHSAVGRNVGKVLLEWIEE